MTWRTEIILHYFESEFEGIRRTVLKTFDEEQLYKYARSTQRHQKQETFGQGVGLGISKAHDVHMGATN